MAIFARVVAGTVNEVFTPPNGFTVAECFHPDMPGAWVDCTTSPGVAEFWTYDGSRFTAPAVSK